jgi:hypothetical protein
MVISCTSLLFVLRSQSVVMFTWGHPHTNLFGLEEAQRLDGHHATESPCDKYEHPLRVIKLVSKILLRKPPPQSTSEFIRIHHGFPAED